MVLKSWICEFYFVADQILQILKHNGVFEGFSHVLMGLGAHYNVLLIVQTISLPVVPLRAWLLRRAGAQLRRRKDV